jgi:glycosyltransferase involved in cell wall biosynthesis
VICNLPDVIAGKPLNYIWIGDGPEKINIEKQVSKMPDKIREKVHFPGSQPDVLPSLLEFDLFVLTSTYEGMPNALLEALAAGLPCVVTDVPGSRDILAGLEIGVLASSSDPKEFANSVRKLLIDPVRMKRMGDVAQKHIQVYYSVDKSVSLHCEVFDDVLSQNDIRDVLVMK